MGISSTREQQTIVLEKNALSSTSYTNPPSGEEKKNPNHTKTDQCYNCLTYHEMNSLHNFLNFNF